MSGSSCTQLVCGTGGWNGPKPGDPDSFSTLTATPAFGGIDLNWTMPLVNPQAVAHTIIYRSTSPLENTAVRHVVASGNFFYDKTGNTNPVRYYYWIQFVSVNGTYSELIGPATAIARPTIEQMIELLTGQIDSGVLAQSLKTEIARIQLNTLGINQEMIDRAANDAALGVAFNEVSAQTDETRALLQTEILARTSANEAFVAAVNTLYAELEGSISAVQSQQTALATAQSSLASDITTVQSSLGEEIASVQVGLQTNINLVGDKVDDIGALYTAKVDVNGLIGGFGVYNDGRIVEAGFDVDRFWIGRTTNKKKPFIIEGNEVFIDQAAINKLTFSKLRDESGSFIVSNGKVKADYITIGNASIDTAQIKNASITSAKIQDLAVDTLQIRGNAVTVPKFAQSYSSIRGNGSNQQALDLWFDVPADSWLYASCTGYLAYGTGWVNASTALYIDGNQVASGGGALAWVSAAHAGAVYFPSAKPVRVVLDFVGQNSQVSLEARSLFAMVVRR